ncbi:hypothetical protein ACQP2Y_46905 (plasmid) [Actinoplanes sp. CA-051413]|uniref:hypothetical protein n=1 Tax=Actinoplanes sp. CA-051413 TaxID=3239899 RepID=UPI003D9775DC
MSFLPCLPTGLGNRQRVPSRAVLIIIVVFVSATAPLLLINGGMPTADALATVAAVAAFAVGFTYQVLALMAGGRPAGGPADASPLHLR